MSKSAPRSLNERPDLIARLCAIFGNKHRLAMRLGLDKVYAKNWVKAGYIPELWALDIEALGAADEWGQITAMDVLYAAQAGRRRRIELAERMRRENEEGSVGETQ